VTSGAMRLQGLLRKVSDRWTADANGRDGQSAILLIVPLGEHHTLGAMTAASWLRMRGVSVCLKIAPGPQELSQLFDAQRFDGIFVSVGSESKIETCAKLTQTLRSLSKGKLPILLGGPLATTKHHDLLSIGADWITYDLKEAMTFLGLGEVMRRRNAG
jgi:MerR family transcriptional regulator, light-induced transcriptional regulator